MAEAFLQRSAVGGRGVQRSTAGTPPPGTTSLNTYAGDDCQQWQAEHLGGILFRFVARHRGKCLDLPGGNDRDVVQLVQRTCNGGTSQKFALTLN